jgi:hypothetical protein
LNPNERTFQFPEETVNRPDHYLVLYRNETDLNLPESGGEVYLSNNNGQLVDMVVYTALPADASFSRDNFGRWHNDWPPSPGKFNSPSGAGCPAVNGFGRASFCHLVCPALCEYRLGHR